MKLIQQLGGLVRGQLISIIAGLQRLSHDQQERIEQQEQQISQLQSSNERLQAVVRELTTQIEAQRAKIDELTRSSKRQAVPFSKGERNPNPKPPGRHKGKGTFSHRSSPPPEEITETLEEPLCSCPECGGELQDMRSHEQFQVDLPLPKPQTTRFVTHSGYCSHCHKRVRSRHPQQVSTAAGAAGVSIGANAKALAADMKHRLGVPYDKIAELFDTAFGLKVTSSALCQSNTRLAQTALPVYEQLCDALRECQAVHADETGWRIGMLSAWLWTFTSQRVTVYVVDESRSSDVVLRILGKEFKGVLHSDCFLAYDHHALDEWLKQKCLGHIQKDLSLMQSQKSGAAIFFPQLLAKTLHKAFVLFDDKPSLPLEEFTRRKLQIEKDLDQLIDESRRYQDPDHERMAKRLRKQRKHLFTFLDEEGCEPTNNRAERALRYAVIIRKTGACNKTKRGAKTHAVLASVTVTARQQGRNPIEYLAELLTAPKTATKTAPQLLTGTLLTNPSGIPP